MTLATWVWRGGGVDIDHSPLVGNFTQMVVNLVREIRAPKLPVIGFRLGMVVMCPDRWNLIEVWIGRLVW